MNARQKSAKKKYMREYMRKYYHNKIKPKLEAQKSKVMKKLSSAVAVSLGAEIKAHAEGDVLVIDEIKYKTIDPIPTPPPFKFPKSPRVEIIDPESPTCPKCGTLRQFILSCPVCNRDPKNPHKPPSPRPCQVRMEQEDRPVEEEGFA